jgi:16S rRNA G527 N7-methylase RsmG
LGRTKALHLPAWHDASAHIETYIDALIKHADARGLLARSQRNAAALWEHVFDSLHALYLIEADSGRPIMDVGSGNGLPGVPLALALPKRPFILVDRSRSKTEFLEYAAALLGLSNVRVLCADLDRGLMIQEEPELVLMRATRGPDSAQVLAGASRAGTRWLVFGTMRNVDRWLKASAEAGFEFGQILPYGLSARVVDRILLEFSHPKK